MINKLFNHLNFNVSKYYSILILDKIISVFFLFFLAKILTESEYGLYSMSISISSYISNILLFGIGTPILVIFSKSSNLSKKTFEVIINLFKISILSLFFFSVFLITFNKFFSRNLFGDESYVIFLLPLIIIFVFDIISEYNIIYHRIKERFIINSKFLIFRNLIRILSFLIFYQLDYSFILSFLFSYLLALFYTLRQNSFFIKFISSVYYSGILLEKKSIESKILKEGFLFLIIYILMNFNLYFINFYIINFIALETYATYAFNLTIVNAPFTIINFLVYYSFPKYLYENKKKLSYKNLIKDFLLGVIVILSFFLFIYFIYDFLLFQLSKNSFSNFNLLTIIYIYMFMNSVVNFLCFPILKEKKYLKLILIFLISILINLTVIFLTESINIYKPILSLIFAQSVVILIMFISIYERKNTFYSTS
tara:strand:- start:11408 stop:12682 length:1275 start_codon:yes stop_codon:yes gene_type:complete